MLLLCSFTVSLFLLIRVTTRKSCKTRAKLGPQRSLELLPVFFFFLATQKWKWPQKWKKLENDKIEGIFHLLWAKTSFDIEYLYHLFWKQLWADLYVTELLFKTIKSSIWVTIEFLKKCIRWKQEHLTFCMLSGETVS